MFDGDKNGYISGDPNHEVGRDKIVKMKCLVSLMCICISVLPVSAFNLENRLPLNKFGVAGSYFGYSVAEHVQTETEDYQDLKW